jgi:DNA-binding LytR/AlgR family response regulator
MSSFCIKADGGHHQIKYSDVLYVEAITNYVSIHTKTRKFTAHYTLRQIEEQLPADLFCRIHRSYIIALEQLTCFTREYVCLDTTQLPVSPQYYEVLKSKLNIISGEKRNKKLNGIHINGAAVLKNKSS